MLRTVAIALALCAGPAPAGATDASQYRFDVPAQPVTEALKAFAERTKLQVVYYSDGIEGAKSPGAVGSLTATEALKKILDGTGFSFRFLNDRTIAIGSTKDVARAQLPTNTSTSANQMEGTLRLVQAEPDQTTASRAQEDSGSVASGNGSGDGSEVVVTGSRLRNVTPTSHVIVITREDISRRGMNTAADIVRSLPQNFSSVNLGSTTTRQGDNETPIGTLGVSAANLRGIGADATLVLVNGRRIASSPSFNGNGQINLGSIPAGAIERVEIVLDGASAIYGADAIGGVINFILMKDYEGSSTKVRFESGANGGDTWSVAQTLGTGWSSGHGLLTAEYSEGKGVSAYDAGWTTDDLRSRGGRDRRLTFASVPGQIYDSNFDFLGSLPASFDGTENWTIADLSPANIQGFDSAATRRSDGASTSNNRSLTLSVEQQLGSRVTAFVDAIYSKNRYNARLGTNFAFIDVPANNPFNRLGEPLTVSYIFTGVDALQASEIERLNLSAGVDVRLPMADWKLNLTGNYGTEKSQGRENSIDPVVAGMLNVFGNGSAQGDLSNVFPMVEGDFPGAEIKSYDAFADGWLFALPGGDVRLGVGVQWRPDSLDLSEAPFVQLVTRPIADVLKLDGRGYFFEASVPVVGTPNARKGVQRLLVNLAGRYDDYTFKGRFLGPDLPEEKREFSRFNPRVGFLWSPVQTLGLRASWGKSFKAPALLELGRGFEVFPGGGVEVRDPLLTDNPATPTVDERIVEVNFGRGGNPNLKPEISETGSYGVEWNPSAIQGLTLEASYTTIDWTDRIEVIRASDSEVWDFLDRLPALIPRDIPVVAGGDGNPATIDAAANVSVNLSGRQLRVLDFTVRQNFNTPFGAMYIGANLARTLEAYDRILPGTPNLRRVGTEVGPDRQVWGGELGWDRGHFGANLFTHYSTDYRNTESTLQARVDSYTTFDATAFYQDDRGLRVNVGVLNLTDGDFPFIDSFRGPYDPSRVDPRGRTMYVEITKAFGGL